MKKFLFSLFIFLIFLSCSKKDVVMNDGIYANVFTNKGEFTIELYYQDAPLTVVNFVGLAEGTISNNAKTEPYFNNMVFHRVIDGFVVQTGDPTGTGMGGPGYNFPDEINEKLSHNAEGIVSMANAGPNTNGSQFFITLSSELNYLDGKHAIFGKVIKGLDVVKKIKQGDKIDKLDIVRLGDEANGFIANSSEFEKLKDKYLELKQEEIKKYNQSQLEFINEKYKNFETDKNGILFKVEKEGSGELPKSESTVVVDYEGFLLDGTKFDSSIDRKAPIEFKLGVGQVIKGWDITLASMKKGEDRTVVIPPNLAYGDMEIPGVIKANSYLVFKISLVDVK